jgi:biopolymer transport protein ExbD
MNVGASGKRQTFNEINITPLTDIFLVLLIIMMVVAPMMQSHRQDIKAPQIANGSPMKQNKLTVEVTKDGVYFVNGTETPATGLTASFTKASATMDASTDKNVVIRADQATRSGAVMAVLESARDAKFTKVTVAGESLSDKRQAELTGATH